MRIRDSSSPANPLELVGAAETAELLGISRSALWDRRGGRGSRSQPPFPEPVAELRCGPIWPLAEVVDYLRASDPERLSALKERGQFRGPAREVGAGVGEDPSRIARGRGRGWSRTRTTSSHV